MGYRWVALVGLLPAGVALLAGCGEARPDCDAVVGRWSWFVGGEVDVTRDGQFTQQSGNSGTWDCSDAARGEVSFRWRAGGFVNRMVVSADGTSLTSVDSTQPFVTALRVSAADAAAPTAANDTQQTTTAQELPASSARGTVTSTQPQSDRTQRIIGLVRSIDAAYAGAQRSFSTLAFKGQSVVLEPGFVLTLRDLECDGDGNARYKDLEFEIPSADRNRLVTQLTADCDAKREGLAWTEDLQRFELTKMRDAKFDVLNVTDGGLGTNSIQFSRLQTAVDGFRPDDVVESTSTIACKDRRGCEQMAADLDALVDAIGMPRSSN